MLEFVAHVDASICSRNLIPKVGPVLVAVSGGLDSVVLLEVLCRLAASRDRAWSISVGHFNHQLRGEQSDGDEALVRSLAQRRRLPFYCRRGDVAERARSEHCSVEVAARQCRHEFLAETAQDLGIPTVALAHHGDDQLESFFLRLFRGAGAEGLSGMSWTSRSAFAKGGGVNLVRPLLDQTRGSLAAFAAQAHLEFREDESNRDLTYQRNRVRHELLPFLTTSFQPALRRLVLREMEILRAESDFVAKSASELLGRKEPIVFENLPLALQRRVLQLQLRELGVAADFELIEELRVDGATPVTVGASLTVQRAGDGRLQVVPKPEDFGVGKLAIDLSAARGEVNLGGFRAVWWIEDTPGIDRTGMGKGTECFDADKIGWGAEVRHWQPGDRFQPIGLDGRSKLQDLFTNAKITANRRREAVLGCTGDGEIWWVEGLRIGERFKLTPATVRRLCWSWARVGS